MRFSSDRTGFPTFALSVHGEEWEVGLWPVMKLQFEVFLAEPPSGFGDTWYGELLALNPRESPWRRPLERPEGLVLSGVNPEEAMAFARWLGSSWQLPDLSLWREIYRSIQGSHVDTEMVSEGLQPQGRAILDSLAGREKRHPLPSLSMMRFGVLEWVRDGGRWALLGDPRQEFAEVLIDPLHGNPLRLVEHAGRVASTGFRLVRPLHGTGVRR